MSLFKIGEGNNLIKQKKVPFDFEKDIQNLVEKNLPILFNLNFIAHKPQYGKLELDTLAFDDNLSTFVIIEYKNKADPGLSDQGLAYRSLFKNHPEFFVLKYNETTKTQISMNDVDWSKIRILFVSTDFTVHQEAIDVPELRIELWRVSRYENDTLSLEKLNGSKTEETILSKVEKIHYEKYTYTEEQHLVKPNKEVKDLYLELKKCILSLGEDVQLEPQKYYLAFKAATNFVDLELQKSAIRCYINLSIGELKDPERKARDVSDTGHRGNGDYDVMIKDKNEIDYLINLISQSYTKNR